MSEAAELAERLRYYNEWRRGADTEMPEPKKIGEDIDAAIRIVEAAEKTLNGNLHLCDGDNCTLYELYEAVRGSSDE